MSSSEKQTVDLKQTTVPKVKVIFINCTMENMLYRVIPLYEIKQHNFIFINFFLILTIFKACILRSKQK